MNLKIGFIGAGAMAEALIRGLLKAGSAPEYLMASDIQPERLAAVRDLFSIRIGDNNQQIFDSSDVVVIAVKPQNLESALAGLKRDPAAAIAANGPNRPLVISIAAGIPLAKLENLLPSDLPVIRRCPIPRP